MVAAAAAAVVVVVVLVVVLVVVVVVVVLTCFCVLVSLDIFSSPEDVDFLKENETRNQLKLPSISSPAATAGGATTTILMTEKQSTFPTAIDLDPMLPMSSTMTDSNSSHAKLVSDAEERLNEAEEQIFRHIQVGITVNQCQSVLGLLAPM